MRINRSRASRMPPTTTQGIWDLGFGDQRPAYSMQQRRKGSSKGDGQDVSSKVSTKPGLFRASGVPSMAAPPSPPSLFIHTRSSERSNLFSVLLRIVWCTSHVLGSRNHNAVGRSCDTRRSAKKLLQRHRNARFQTKV